MQIAFYIENRTLTSIDFHNVSEGNPGVGGSEYMTAVIATLLSQRNNEIEVLLMVEAEGSFIPELKQVIVDDLEDCIIKCNELSIDYLFFKHDMRNIHRGILELKDENIKNGKKTGLIPWCHNFAPYEALDYYTKNKSITRILCVGREQQDLYRDLKAFRKSDYIYNCISETALEKYYIYGHPFGKRKNCVTYIGAIGPQKGFHWLAEAWPIVLEEIPDAELYVIGSGALYSRDWTMGRYGIASKEYEEVFMPYLTDEKGAFLPSVHFMGIMGEEKNEILLQTKVGVPNPSGFSETFGISAVEMQAMGCKVATIKCAGYLDTVKNGILYNQKSELAQSIISLLKTNSNDYPLVKQFILENFSQKAIIKEWERFILDALPNNKHLHEINDNNMDFEHKRIKEFMRKIKCQIPFLYNILPTVEVTFRIIDKLLRRKACHPHRNIGY